MYLIEWDNNSKPIMTNEIAFVFLTMQTDALRISIYVLCRNNDTGTVLFMISYPILFETLHTSA